MAIRKTLTSIKKSFISSVDFTGNSRLLSKNPVRRYVWLVTILIACIACSIHLYLVVSEFQEYAVNTVVENNEFSFIFPDVTICTTMPFGGKKYKEKGTDLKSGQRFWMELLNKSKSLDNDEMMFAKAVLSLQNFPEHKNLLVDMFTLMRHCQYRRQPCYRDRFFKFSSSKRLNCNTFSPKDRRIFVPDRKTGLHLILSIGDGETESDRNTELHDLVGFDVMIHEPGSLPEIGKDAVLVEPGTQVMMRLTMKNYTRESTSKTPCQDQENIKNTLSASFRGLQNMDNSFQESYTEDDCVPVLTTQTVIRRCKCILESYNMPWHWNTTIIPYCHKIPEELYYNERIQNRTIYTKDSKSYNLDTNKTISEIMSRIMCADNFVNHEIMNDESTRKMLNLCPNRCLKSWYYKDITVSKWPKSKKKTMETLNEYAKSYTAFNLFVNSTIKNINEIDKMASILIYPSDLSVDVTSESLAYPLSQLFADFGGNIGLWIGVSLLTVAELIEFFIRVIVLRIQGSKEAPEIERDISVDDEFKKESEYENDDENGKELMEMGANTKEQC